jgi:hypothetical protein
VLESLPDNYKNVLALRSRLCRFATLRFSKAKKGGEGKMTTGKKAASDASRILSDPKSTKKEKEVAASDLAQARKGKGKGK